VEVGKKDQPKDKLDEFKVDGKAELRKKDGTGSSQRGERVSSVVEREE